MKLLVELSVEELRQSRERYEKAAANGGVRLSPVAWIARDLAVKMASRYARSQKASWAIVDMLRPAIEAQLNGGQR